MCALLYDAYLNALAFIFGLFFGSFANVLIYRIPRKEEWVKTPSHCPQCGHRLAWYELIPVFSWAVQRGRCRACGKPISPRYPAVELANALLWLICAAAIGPSFFLPAALFVSTCLLALSIIDWETNEISDGFHIALLAVGLLWNIYGLFSGAGILIENLIGFFAVSLPLLLIAMITKGGMGGADIKLMAACGLILGWPRILMALALASIIGTLIMLPRHIIQKRERFEEVPFGPFLSAGVFLSMCFGHELISWYISILL